MPTTHEVWTDTYEPLISIVPRLLLFHWFYLVPMVIQKSRQSELLLMPSNNFYANTKWLYTLSCLIKESLKSAKSWLHILGKTPDTIFIANLLRWTPVGVKIYSQNRASKVFAPANQAPGSQRGRGLDFLETLVTQRLGVQSYVLPLFPIFRSTMRKNAKIIAYRNEISHERSHNMRGPVPRLL